MITIFACLRHSKGQFAIIQRNAIISWTLLSPKPEIILLGDDEGTAEICHELGLIHVPEVARSKFGGSLVNDLFEKAQRLAKYDLICYVNSDVIVTQSLIQAIDIVRKQWKRFVLFCGVWNLAIEHEIDFRCLDWEDQLRNLVHKNEKTPVVSQSADLFLFPKWFYRNIPPFAVGGSGWDSWLIFKTRAEKIPLIDASKFMFIVHADHDGTTHSDRWIKNKDHDINLSLTSWWPRTFMRLDAPYSLERDGIIRKKRILELLHPRINAIKSRYLFNNKIWMVGCRVKRRLVFFKQKIRNYIKKHEEVDQRPSQSKKR